MGYVNAKAPSAVYHLTPKKNLDAIIKAKIIKRFGDTRKVSVKALATDTPPNAVSVSVM